MKNESYKAQVVILVSKKLNIEECEWHDINDNIKSIESKSQKIIQDLNNYFEAYDAWRDFVDKMDNGCIATPLSPVDNSKYFELSNKQSELRIILVKNFE